MPNALEPKGYLTNIESFIFEGTGTAAVIVGYKSLSGDIYPLPSFSEMKKIGGYDSPIKPRYIPKGVTPNPSVPPFPAQPCLSSPQCPFP